MTVTAFYDFWSCFPEKVFHPLQDFSHKIIQAHVEHLELVSTVNTTQEGLEVVCVCGGSDNFSQGTQNGAKVLWYEQLAASQTLWCINQSISCGMEV